MFRWLKKKPKQGHANPKWVFLVGLEHHVARLVEKSLDHAKFDRVEAEDIDHAISLARERKPAIVVLSREEDAEEFNRHTDWVRKQFDPVSNSYPFEKTHFINVGNLALSDPFGGFGDGPTAPAVVTPVFPRKRR